MFPMQESSREAESVPSEGQRILVFNATWIIWFAVLAYIGFVVWLLLQEEDYKLNFLHTSIRILHSIAHSTGWAALALEQRYNEHIELLH